MLNIDQYKEFVEKLEDKAFRKTFILKVPLHEEELSADRKDELTLKVAFKNLREDIEEYFFTGEHTVFPEALRAFQPVMHDVNSRARSVNDNKINKEIVWVITEQHYEDVIKNITEAFKRDYEKRKAEVDATVNSSVNKLFDMFEL